MSNFVVPYTAFQKKNIPIREKLVAAFEKVIDSGLYIQGPEVASFEKEFASYCGSAHAAGVANGTCSIYLTLRAAGIGAGDEVITAPNSFIASAAAIAMAGATPVFADVTEDMNIDPAAVEAAITPRTKALLPVHLAGRPANMTSLMEIAGKKGLFVLEDAAQSVGAKWAGRRVGSWGHAGSFSLHPLKNLHAFGDAGAITSNDATLLQRVNQHKNHGLKTRDRCEFWSENARLDELQAALLRVQLAELDRWTEERRRLAQRYHRLLKPFVGVPEEKEGEYHVYQAYVVLAPKRDELQAFLTANGVEALIHYPTPIHCQPAAASLGYQADDFPMTLDLSRRILSLPLYPCLTEAQQDYVAGLFARFYK